jgi:two-component system, OmpR family, KDP operon response regulator KdpE
METVSAPATLLLIEDDPAIRRLIQAGMGESTTAVRIVEASTASEGIELAARRKPDVILLDLGLPDGDGLAVLKAVRSWSGVPIIVVSAREQEDLKVAALESGADDYVTKPFGVGELWARVKVALRRGAQIGTGPESFVFENGDLYIDLAARQVKIRGKEAHLTPLEYKLLCVLAKHAGKVVTHRQLLAEVWGEEYSDEAQYLRVYMGYLRKKLEADPSRPTIILTEPRIGYRLAA